MVPEYALGCDASDQDPHRFGAAKVALEVCRQLDQSLAGPGRFCPAVARTLEIHQRLDLEGVATGKGGEGDANRLYHVAFTPIELGVLHSGEYSFHRDH